MWTITCLVSVLLLATTSVMAQPTNHKLGQAKATIVKYQYNNHGDGTYNFYYETSDGSFREENGTLTKKPTGEEILVVHGLFSYGGDDGKKYTVRYTADENGFKPEGAHLNKGFRPSSTETPEEEVIIDMRIDPKLIGTLLGGGLG